MSGPVFSYGIAGAVLIDDSRANLRGAEAVGIAGFQLVPAEGGAFNTGELLAVVEAFAAERPPR